MDWLGWHQAYADTSSPLARRLLVVRAHVGEVLDAAGSGPIRILSLCAGDGRDVLAELAARPALRAITTLVERDHQLAGSARTAAKGVTDVDVRQGDAGEWASFVDVLPVDLLLLCGIFGNISATDIHATVVAVPSMLAVGATVIWTRGRFTGQDLRPTIRRWFVETGLSEVAFEGDPEPFGVGVARAQGDPRSARPTGRLFGFIR